MKGPSRFDLKDWIFFSKPQTVISPEIVGIDCGEFCGKIRWPQRWYLICASGWRFYGLIIQNLHWIWKGSWKQKMLSLSWGTFAVGTAFTCRAALVLQVVLGAPRSRREEALPHIAPRFPWDTSLCSESSGCGYEFKCPLSLILLPYLLSLLGDA